MPRIRWRNTSSNTTRVWPLKGFSRPFGYSANEFTEWNATAEDGKSENAIDVILCPAGPGAAPPLDCSRYWGYTSQWNLLDYAALVFPVTAVDPLVDLRDGKYVPRNEQDQYNHDLCKLFFSFLLLFSF